MYQILIILKNENIYEEYDLLKNEKDIVSEYIYPYLENKEFFIGSNFVKRSEINEIIIKQTPNPIESYRRRLEAIEPSDLSRMSRILAIKSSITGENLASQLIKKYNKFVENKQPLKNEVNEKVVEKKMNNKIFIVHGHDNLMKETVARFIERLGLEAVILHEQANGGKTIIEKIEKNTDVGYGIVLYSPCDEGKSKTSTELKNRARQNVVFEHGYLLGKLGRENVIALNNGDVEVPSDISGIVYIAYNISVETWKTDIIRELSKKSYKLNIEKALNLFKE